jgi:hypothetical protein
LAELNQSTVTLGNLYDSIRNLDQIDNRLEEEKPERTADTSSTKAILPTELQVSSHRIAKYTSDGKPVMT